MKESNAAGWKNLLMGFPWFSGKAQYPIPAYSEFMPPPRLGRTPYDGQGDAIFVEGDPYHWYISEVEEELELQPGLANLAHQILEEIVKLGRGQPAYRIGGQQGRNLQDNIYWPLEFAKYAGKLPHERFVVLLPLALSRTQDDKGRVRWTYFGGSEQGPERAFWQSFYSSPGRERPAEEAISFFANLLSQVYGETCVNAADLFKLGFRVLTTATDPQFPYWNVRYLPSWTKSFLWHGRTDYDDVRYLLTFQPFGQLPAPVRARYLAGQLMLLPFPGSLVFWGMPDYRRFQKKMVLAMQLPLQHMAVRRDGPDGLRVPQAGHFHESGSDFRAPEAPDYLLLNTYKRTSRWDRIHRYENEAVVSTIEDTIARVLFSTDLDAMRLYNKPMAKNCQLWTKDGKLLLDGPRASRAQLETAANIVAQGGTFRYRFIFPPMCVGLHEVYWQRPLAAWWNNVKNDAELLGSAPLGYFTAYRQDKPDLSQPVELWPILRRREPYLSALCNYEHIEEHYLHNTARNIVRVFNSRELMARPLPRSLAREIVRLPENESLETWLAALPSKALDHTAGEKLRQGLENCLESASPSPSALPVEQRQPITFGSTASRSFEENWWNDIKSLSTGDYLNKDNADCVRDPITTAHLVHHHRDLEHLGDYLMNRHTQAIAAAGMKDKAFCGELPFVWDTDFDFSVYGGWKNNQEGHTHERDLLVVIPGKNRNEAVIMADHYDTAYMEDVYNKSQGGDGARLSAAGADDNCSATATLLQAAPLFLQLSKEGRLERDIWLVHLTGEEFPSDCMGARHLAEALVEKTLHMSLNDGQTVDLSGVRVTGVYIMDMIAHNRENEKDIFQITPGKGSKSLQLAWQAHLANEQWNLQTKQWNQIPERRGAGRGKRISGIEQIPQLAEFLRLQGEVRLPEDPHSSLFNTDGQIFSDCGVPVVLFMENYDINRKGYHDTRDTMENLDLDFGAALAAIAIESVAHVASIK
jgi:hypothetical protein